MALFENRDFFMLVGGVKAGGGGGGGGGGGVESNPGGTSETVETLLPLFTVVLPNVPEKLDAINNNKLFVKDGKLLGTVKSAVRRAMPFTQLKYAMYPPNAAAFDGVDSLPMTKSLELLKLVMLLVE